MLLLKAQEHAEVCGCENPKKLNLSWINRWKVRKDIVCKKLHREAESVDQNGVDEWQTNCLLAFLKQFKAEDIFNATKPGCFIDAYQIRLMFLKMTSVPVENFRRKD